MMHSAKDAVGFVQGPLTRVCAIPTGLNTTFDGSFVSIRQNRSRFCAQVSGKPYRSPFGIKMMAGNEDPLLSSELDSLKQIPVTRQVTDSEPPSGLITVPVADLQLPISSLKLQEVDGRTQLVAEVDQDGVPYLDPPIPTTTALSGELFSDSGLRAVDGPGFVPSKVSVVDYLPTQAPEEGLKIPEDEKERKQGGTIFGIDDRFIIKPDKYPWRITGQIRTAKGRCTGVVIGPRLVLTASHCVNWGPDRPSWIGFSPAYYDGNRPYGEHFAIDIIYWNKAAGRLTDLETAFDYAVLVMSERIGDNTGYAGYRTYSESWNGGGYWEYVGYAADLASGERPSLQRSCTVSSSKSESMSGQDAFVLGHFSDFTPGQSGGCAWGWWSNESFPRVVGVGSTIGSTAVKPSGTTADDNEYGGGDALSALIAYARNKYP